MKQQVKIYKVKGNPKNPRVIKNDKFKSLKNSIKTLPNYMKLRPIILNEDMMVLGGNMRLKASIDLGKKEIWTDMFTQADCDEMNEIAIEEKRETKTYLEYCDEIIIKDNVSAGDWEWDMLANEWDSVQLNDFGLDVWENEDDVKEGLIEDDEIPEVKESIVKRGDIWQLGEHRVMCGDSTSSDDVAKLMNGEKADLVITDPPYNVALGNETIEQAKKRNRRIDGLTLKNDKLSDKDFLQFLTNFFTTTYINTKKGGAIYVFFADMELRNFVNGFLDGGFKLSQQLIWKKSSLVMGRKDYQSMHEPILYGWNEGEAHNWYKDRKQTTILEFDKPSRNKEHPTMKPIKLIEYLMVNSSKKGDLIKDGFLGSGTTLIAAEKLKRKCYGMELDEKYCDVIIERWEQFTGLKAEKV